MHSSCLVARARLVHWIATEVIALAEHFSSTLAMKVLFFEKIGSPENKSREKNKWSKSYVIFVASRFFLPKTLFLYEWDDFRLFDGLQGWNPVFDRGPLEDFYYNTGLPFDWASSFNALIVFGEHRWPFLGGGRVRGGLIMLAHLDDGNGSWNSTSCLNITLLKSQVLWTDLALWKCLFWQGLPDCHLLDLVGDLAWLHLVCYKRQENLGYLSISQVIADYAMLVQHLQALELQWFFL